MGLIAASSRLTQLNRYRLELEEKMQLISDKKFKLLDTVNDLTDVSAGLDEKAPEVKALEARKLRLQAIEKQLDVQMQRYETQLKMVDAEIQSCKQLVDKNIQLMYGGR
jgi:capsule polysaccharide export protein KpsE/RkpR